MALIKCPECGKEISNQAISCPNCGYVVNQDKIAQPKSEVSIKYLHETLVGISLAVELICLYYYNQFKEDLSRTSAVYFFDNDLPELLEPIKNKMSLLTVVMIAFGILLVANVILLIIKKSSKA